MTLLNEIDAAVRVLRAAGCYRESGCWWTKDGAALAMDPLEAFRLLKREQLRSGMESELPRSGGRMTREYFPDGIR